MRSLFISAFVALPLALPYNGGTSASPVVPVKLLSFATWLPIPLDFVPAEESRSRGSKEASKEQGGFFTHVAVGERRVF